MTSAEFNKNINFLAFYVLLSFKAIFSLCLVFFICNQMNKEKKECVTNFKKNVLEK